MVWAAAIPAIASLAGSIFGGNKAAKAEERASQAGIDEQRRQYDLSRLDYTPWRSTGENALYKLSRMYGLGGYNPYGSAGDLQSQYSAMQQGKAARTAWENKKFLGMGRDTWDWLAPGAKYMPREASAMFGSPGPGLFRNQGVGLHDYMNDPKAGSNYSASDMSAVGEAADRARSWDAMYGGQGAPMGGGGGGLYDDFYMSPDYQFALQEGLKSLDRSASARGGLGGGANLKDLMRFGSGLASQQFGDYKNSLMSLAGLGQTSTSNLANLGANMAGNVGNLMSNQGASRASAYTNQANALNNFGQNMTYAYMMNQQKG